MEDEHLITNSEGVECFVFREVFDSHCQFLFSVGEGTLLPPLSVVDEPSGFVDSWEFELSGSAPILFLSCLRW